MTKHFYAGYNSYGTQIVYGGYWTVYRFKSKVARDEWVSDDRYPNGNPTREAITRDIARHIMGSWTNAIPAPSGDDCEMLVFDHESRDNPFFWG